MLAFACPIASEAQYTSYALPGIRRAAEPDSVLVTRHGLPLQVACNQMLDELSQYAGLEAAVIMHEDVEIVDDAFAVKVRRALTDSQVAVIGAMGARDVTGMAWWEGEPMGQVWAPQIMPPGEALGTGLGAGCDVDAVDGVLLIFSAVAVRELRFDEAFVPYRHGYDVDLCFQARARGWRVRVEPVEISHHSTPEFFDREPWIEAAVLFQHKWRGLVAGDR